MIRAILGLTAALVFCAVLAGCGGSGNSTSEAERKAHERPEGRAAPAPEKPAGADFNPGQQTGSK